MKTLQNNFTTPEQSKRLLELGLPVDSADCYYTWKLDHTTKINVLDNETYSELLDPMSQFTIPCWSVGRLIEILLLCHMFDEARIIFNKPLYKVSNCTNIEWCIRVLESSIQFKHIDFSKLEE